MLLDYFPTTLLSGCSADQDREGAIGQECIGCEEFHDHIESEGLTGQIMTVFLDNILNKRYTSPSSDIISVLTGLDGVDTAFGDFVTTLDNTIRSGRTCKYTDDSTARRGTY